MDTAYKTRAWWMLRALDYMRGIERAPTNTDYRQIAVWHEQGLESAANALAPAGSECLTRLYVDRQGNLLPQYLAS